MVNGGSCICRVDGERVSDPKDTQLVVMLFSQSHDEVLQTDFDAG